MPAKGKKRSAPKYKQHDNLRKALQLIGVEENIRAANMLLDWGVSREIDNLSAGFAKAYGAVTKTQNFSDLRSLLKEHEYLDFVEPKDKNESTYVKYLFGPKLSRYINRELAGRDVLATRSEVETIETKVDGLAERVEKLEGLVRMIIAKTNPPVTDEKVDLALNDPESYTEAFIGSWLN